MKKNIFKSHFGIDYVSTLESITLSSRMKYIDGLDWSVGLWLTIPKLGILIWSVRMVPERKNKEVLQEGDRMDLGEAETTDDYRK